MRRLGFGVGLSSILVCALTLPAPTWASEPGEPLGAEPPDAPATVLDDDPTSNAVQVQSRTPASPPVGEKTRSALQDLVDAGVPIEWEAPACAPLSALDDALTRHRLGEATRPNVLIAMRIDEQTQAYHLHAELAAGDLVEVRDIQSTDCEQLVDTAGLLAAIALDTEAHEEPPPPAAPPEPTRADEHGAKIPAKVYRNEYRAWEHARRDYDDSQRAPDELEQQGKRRVAGGATLIAGGLVVGAGVAFGVYVATTRALAVPLGSKDEVGASSTSAVLAGLGIVAVTAIPGAILIARGERQKNRAKAMRVRSAGVAPIAGGAVVGLAGEF